MGPDQGMGGPQGPDDSMGQDPTADMPPTDDSLPQGPEMDGVPGDDMPEEGEPGEEVEDEDVIDVDDLTQSQEATEYKIDGVNDKISALLQVTSKFVDALKDNEQQIQDLKKEIERRNPTPEERMNIRSQSSYPYGETPRDYWDRKREENPNYNVIYDNDISPKDEDKEFEIRREDLENLDKRSLADSLEFPKELRDYLDF
jgi:TolA-binding protein